MFRDLLNHQRVFNIPKNFISKLPKKITPNEYLVKRLNYEGIFVGFMPTKYPCPSPFFNFTRDYNDFTIINDNREFLIPYYAKSYYENTNKMGVVFNTSKYGYTYLIPEILKTNHYGIPLLLISFYNSHEELKVSQPNIFKDKYRITKASEVPNILEYMIQLSNMSRQGVTHIQIENTILTETITLENQ